MTECLHLLQCYSNSSYGHRSPNQAIQMRTLTAVSRFVAALLSMSAI